MSILMLLSLDEPYAIGRWYARHERTHARSQSEEYVCLESIHLSLQFLNFVMTEPINSEEALEVLGDDALFLCKLMTIWSHSYLLV